MHDSQSSCVRDFGKKSLERTRYPQTLRACFECMENGFVCLDGESEGVVAGLAHAHWAPTRSVQMIHASVVPYPCPQLQNEEVKCTSRNTHKPVDRNWQRLNLSVVHNGRDTLLTSLLDRWRSKSRFRHDEKVLRTNAYLEPDLACSCVLRDVHITSSFCSCWRGYGTTLA